MFVKEAEFDSWQVAVAVMSHHVHQQRHLVGVPPQLQEGLDAEITELVEQVGSRPAHQLDHLIRELERRLW